MGGQSDKADVTPGVAAIPAVGDSLFMIYLVDGENTWMAGTPAGTEDAARRDAERMMRHREPGFASHFAIIEVRVVASPGLEAFVSKKRGPEYCDHCGAEKHEP